MSISSKAACMMVAGLATAWASHSQASVIQQYNASGSTSQALTHTYFLYESNTSGAPEGGNPDGVYESGLVAVNPSGVASTAISASLNFLDKQDGYSQSLVSLIGLDQNGNVVLGAERGSSQGAAGWSWADVAVSGVTQSQVVSALQADDTASLQSLVKFPGSMWLSTDHSPALIALVNEYPQQTIAGFTLFTFSGSTEADPGVTTGAGVVTLTAVPEPASLSLVALGAGALLARRRRH